MSDGLDTSVVLRLLTGVPVKQAEIARVFAANAESPVFVSDLVVGETYYALLHHYRVPHLEAVRALNELLGDARVQSSGVAKGVLATVSQQKPSRKSAGLLDQLMHADYARDDVKLATFDRDLSQMPGAQLLS